MVIDRSSSMSSRSVTPDSSAIRTHGSFNAALDNVLGVVYEASHKYMCERRARSPQDLVTFIPFDNSAHVHFHTQQVTNVDALLTSMLQVAPRGGTVFVNALNSAHQSVHQVQQQGAA
jgi:von Willebrand factor type A domain